MTVDPITPAQASSTQPRIRTTRGPTPLSFGPHSFTPGEWRTDVSPQVAESMLRPDHIAAFGIEAEGYPAALAEEPATAPAKASPATTPAPQSRTTASSKKE